MKWSTQYHTLITRWMDLRYLSAPGAVRSELSWAQEQLARWRETDPELVWNLIRAIVKCGSSNLVLARFGAGEAGGRLAIIELGRGVRTFDCHTQPVYGLCMATKTISVETDAYTLLAREKRDHTESFSRVIRRLFAERPALTAGELLDVMQEFKGKGAGPRRKRS